MKIAPAPASFPLFARAVVVFPGIFSYTGRNKAKIMSVSSNQEREIFIAALERPTPAERAAYLDGACSGDAELRAKVGELLSAHELAGGFLGIEDSVLPGAGFTKEPGRNFGILPLSEKPGDHIDRYKILQKVGEGGCGVV